MKEALENQNGVTTTGVIEQTESEPLNVSKKVDVNDSVEAAAATQEFQKEGVDAHGKSNDTTNGSLQPNGTSEPEIDVLVVGAGFSGVYALHRLRKAGFRVKLYEKAPDYGGTWYWNRYPGAAVDSEIPLYQFSQYETYCDWNWKDRFPGHEEIRSYFTHLGNVWDLRKDTVFNTAVTKMQVSGGHWVSETDKGDKITSKFIVAATGSSHKQFLPAFPGIESFKGEIYHSSNWPHQGLDVIGKRVAIIGNGASGVQLLQELAKSDCQITAYIRSPAVNLPMNQRKPSAKEQAGNRSFYDALLASCKKTGHGFPYVTVPGSFHTASEEERVRVFEELWARGGFAYFMANYPEWTYDTSINKIVYNFWREKTEVRVKNPQKRAIVCPVEQPYWLGTKRSNLEQDYYESLDRPNVELRSIQKSPFKEFTETSIVTEDGESREFDIIILATGYDNITGSLFDLNASDKHGVSLREKWKSGVHTSYGLTVPSMPNFFMMYSVSPHVSLPLE